MCRLCMLYVCFSCVLFFFFKQKTAYEMRISDWSSDVCSSDLMTRLRWRQDDRKHRCELVAHQGKSLGMNPHITVRRVETAADRKAFVELAFRDRKSVV